MPPKRKAAESLAGRVSKRSTPLNSPRTPQSVGTDDSDHDYSDDPEDEVHFTEEQRQREKTRDKLMKKFTEKSKFANIRARKGYKRSSMFGDKDFSRAALKPDHEHRPLWIDARVTENSTKGPRVTIESFHPLKDRATDLLITIGEPISRPTLIHEYRLTEHSLYAALSVGMTGEEIKGALDRFCKTAIPEEVVAFIDQNTKTFGKVKLVLRQNKFFIESEDEEIVRMLQADPVIGPCVAAGAEVQSGRVTTRGAVIQGTAEAKGMRQAQQQQAEAPRADIDAETEAMLQAMQDDSEDEEDEKNYREAHTLEIAPNKRETVAEQCLAIGFPAVSEYDFEHDDVNADLPIDLKPNTQIRPYQEKALSKMFGNKRAKSGIIVLPCGAGKTLVGITAACHIKKSVVVLCTSAMSVHQWANEFKKWSDIKEEDIATFSSDSKKRFAGASGVLVSTYSMMAMDKDPPPDSKKRVAHDTRQMLEWVQGREWGLMILDEVHVVPARMFRKVGEQVRSHCKLGLTATLLREDDKIEDLNFLIGPKLYEANWMELSKQGHIARVQCAEVWCPMTMEFYQEYQQAPPKKRLLFYACNPTKYQVCQFLINYHEARGDKIIVFSDNLFALKHYATSMGKAYIDGSTSNNERLQVLENFQHNELVNTIFLSKIGDTSLDLPEATVLIQVSSHYGSRRQEAQRLGRILRAKRRNDEGFNAFFYSLVSKDTTEMAYSAKRQAFLVDQGYAFKTITHLNGMDKAPGIAYRDARERQELLANVMLQSEEANEIGDKNMRGQDNLWAAGSQPNRKPKPVVRRTGGSLAEVAGGGVMAPVYQERARGTKANSDNLSGFFGKESRRQTNQVKKRKAEAAAEANAGEQGRVMR